MTTLLIAEHDNKILNEANKKAMDAATKIGEEVHILVAGKDCSEVANQASKIAGVSKVLLCDNPIYEKHMAESYADLVVEISSDYNAILTTASTTGKNFMPRVAALLDVPQISEIINVIDSNTFERPIYAGNAIQTVKSLSAKKIITVSAPSFQAAEDQDPATVENIQHFEDKNLSEYISEELTKSDRPELTAAKIIISGGRGMQNGENFVLLEGVADKLGAALGLSLIHI